MRISPFAAKYLVIEEKIEDALSTLHYIQLLYSGDKKVEDGGPILIYTARDLSKVSFPSCLVHWSLIVWMMGTPWPVVAASAAVCVFNTSCEGPFLVSLYSGTT